MGKRSRKVVSASLATALVASGSPCVASFAQDMQEAASQLPPNPVGTAEQTLDSAATAASSSQTVLPALTTISAWPTEQGDNKTDNAQSEPTAQPSTSSKPQPIASAKPSAIATPTLDATPTPDVTVQPTAEPTVAPVAEPTDELAKDVTPEPTAEPTAEFTKDVTPELTPEPTSDPKVEPTPEPQPTPEPEHTPEPNPEPTKDVTPEPTQEPSEAPSEEPTQAPVVPASTQEPSKEAEIPVVPVAPVAPVKDTGNDSDSKSVAPVETEPVAPIPPTNNQVTTPGNRQEISGEDVITSIELPRPGDSSESSISSSGSSSSSSSTKAPNDGLDDDEDDPLRSGGTTLGRIAVNNGSNDSIPGAADWVAGYLSRNTTDEDHSQEASPSNFSSSALASKSSSSSTSAIVSHSAKSVAKADGANAAQEQAVKNADADDSGLSGIAPLILFSLIGLVLIALAIRYFSRGA